jgi:RecB family exonuclease
MMPPVTPRRTRLVRTPDLPHFQRAIAVAALDADPAIARDTAVLVPTFAAADELRQTLEELSLVEEWRPSEAERERVGQGTWPSGLSFVLPHLVTRAGLYELLAARLDATPPMVDRLGREVLFEGAAARAVASGVAPPFEVRPALIAEMQGFYDALGRNLRSIDDFERLVGGPLDAGSAIDRGARRLLEQTRFLAATFREYEQAIAAREELDERRLRAHLLTRPSPRPLRRLVITIPDQAASPGGLFPADYDLLTRLPGLESLLIVATETVLATGYLPRMLEQLPEIDVQVFPSGEPAATTLVAPSDEERLYFVSRDREQELADFARRHRTRTNARAAAFVYQRPLPYLTLARQVFDAQGLAWQAIDAQPLAAEPWAAALDLVLTFATTEYARGPSLALLRAPQFRIAAALAADSGSSSESAGLPRQDLAACDRELRDAGYFGGRDRLAEIADRWRRSLADPTAVTDDGRGASRRAAYARRRKQAALRVLDVIAAAAERVSPLEVSARPSAHLDVLEAFLRFVDAPPTDEADRARWLRARGAVLAIVGGLRSAFLERGESARPFADVAALLRRLLEEQTFNPRIGPGDVHLVDAEAAPYGRFTHATLAGVVEGEWPSSGARGIFYPSSLLRDLGWPAETDRRAAARAAFDDLLRLPLRAVELSTFSLDDEAIVRPSPYIEDLDRAGLSIERVGDAERDADVALHVTALVQSEADAWRALRQSRSSIELPAFHGAAGAVAPRVYSVTSLDRYRQCPFKYFAADVLALEEEPDDRPGLTVQERGQFVHEVFRDFFERWSRTGQGAIEAMNLGEARTLFAAVVDEHLLALPESERPLERTRLMGSIAGAGLGERTFRFEASRTAPIVERLLEFPLDGLYQPEGHAIRLRGTADRIDLLADGTLRLLDYKTGKASSARDTLQIPIYALCAEERLAGHRGRSWEVSEAGYLAFGRAEPFVPVVSGDDRAEAVAKASEGLIETTRQIESGAFPVTPDEPHMCMYCGFSAVCRKDYVEEV